MKQLAPPPAHPAFCKQIDWRVFVWRVFVWRAFPWRLIVALVFGVLALLSAYGADAAAKPESKKTYKILHIMSYHSPWRWTDLQLDGFKEGLGDVTAEYKVIQMNAKRESAPSQLEEKSRQIKELIKTWQPDLVYSTDDEAQQYVVKHYLNSNIPFVFSGVNRTPETYGFDTSNNVTGAVEHEHFVESVRLLQAISPHVRKIAVVFDEAPLWPPVKERMRERVKQLPGVEFSSWDTITTFADFKKKMRGYQSTADAVALIGIFNFKDERGVNVPYGDVLKWTAENSKLPDFGYWIDRVHHGTLAAVTVSEHEQGLVAGRMARHILIDGKKPADIPFQPTAKGLPVVSLARAKKLGIKINSSVLLSAQVVQEFEWEK